MPTEPPSILPAALSVAEAVKYTGLSRTTLYKLSAEAGTGRLPVVRVAGRRLFLRTDLDAYLAKHRAA